jgi:hypothetical protein
MAEEEGSAVASFAAVFCPPLRKTAAHGGLRGDQVKLGGGGGAQGC